MQQTDVKKPRATLNGPIMVSLLLGGVLFVAVTGIFLFASFPASQRQEFLASLEEGVPERHLIPEGYHGWITVEHNVAGEAELPVEDGVNIFRYSESGQLRTSSRWRPGIKKKTFLFETVSGPVTIAKGGPERQIWGNMDVTMRDVKDGPIKSRQSRFFVGTRAEYKKAGRYSQQQALETVLEQQRKNHSSDVESE